MTDWLSESLVIMECGRKWSAMTFDIWFKENPRQLFGRKSIYAAHLIPLNPNLFAHLTLGPDNISIIVN